MMHTTPAHRIAETCSCRNHMAANVANTKLSPVSGHSRLMSLSRHEDQQADEEQGLAEHA